MDRTTLTANLKPLARRALVAVASDPRDRRSRLLLSPRPAGRCWPPPCRCGSGRMRRSSGASAAATTCAPTCAPCPHPRPEGDIMTVQPYLMFDGRCEEAIDFYRER